MVEIRKGFKFCQATVNNLKELVSLGIVRNETEAIDLSVQHFLSEHKTRKQMGELQS